MRITALYTQTFSRKFKKYAKKTQFLSADLRIFIDRLENTKPIDLGGNAYKYRLSVKSKKQRQKRGLLDYCF